MSGGHTTYGGGSDFYETPNVSRLASEGLCFSSAYACQNCVPTRAAILSGQYPTRTGIYNVGSLNRNVAGATPLVGPENHQDVPSSTWTMAEMLRAAGYVTCHVGKYHVGGHEEGSATLPLNQGFDYNYGGTSAGSATAYRAATNAVGVWAFNDSVGPELDAYAQPYNADYQSRYRVWAQPLYTLPSSLLGTAKHVGDAVADAALDFMEAHRTNGAPFYLQFHEYLVHVPLQARADLKAYYDQKKLSRPSRMGHDNTIYAAMVAQFDLSVGRVLAYLHDPNGDGNASDSIATNTLVLFFSDNGGYLGSTANPPLRGGKGMQTEGGLRVPLVAWMPGTIPHRTNDSLVQMVDFYPTLAEMAGGALPDPIAQPLDGMSLVPVLQGLAGSSGRQANYWHFPGYLDTRSRPCSTIVKDLFGKRYKLHYYYEDLRHELFCLTDDIGETNDLLATVSGQAAAWSIATNLSADLRAWLDRTGAIYPTNRATGQVVPPPVPLAGPPPRSAQSLVNVQLLHSSVGGTGPSGNRLWGVLGCDWPVWNTYTELQAQTVKSNLVDEHGRPTPVTFISHAPALLAFGPNQGNPAFDSSGGAGDFFYTHQFLSGGGTPGVPATNSFALGGLVPGNQYDLVFYANWNLTNAGSTFTVNGVAKTADGVPHGSDAGFSEGHSYVQFRQARPDTNGVLNVTWATYAPPNGRHRGPLNAVQVRGDFTNAFATVFRVDAFSRNLAQNCLSLSWQSRENRAYALLGSTDLQTWTILSNTIPSGGLTTTLNLPLAVVNGGPEFYFKVQEQ